MTNSSTQTTNPKSSSLPELSSACEFAAAYATKHGADHAEVIARSGAELSVKVRMGQPESVQEASSRALGLRVIKDGREALTYTSDLRRDSLRSFVDNSIVMAELAEPDEFNALPETGLFAKEIVDLELCDESVGTVDGRTALAFATAAEKAALGYDSRVTNSEGASWSRTSGGVAFANSAGFVGSYRGSYASMYVEPICDDTDGKKRNGYWWTAGRYLSDLEAPETVGAEAARRTVATLGARKVPTCQIPVVFDPEAGRGLVGMVASLSSGTAFYRKSSYLVDRENTQVASDLVTIVDNPLVPRGPGSRPFDGDGLQTRRNVVVSKGVLRGVLCDVYSGRKLGRPSTASAGRGIGSGSSVTTSNLYMEAGTTSREDLIRSTKKGLYVTSTMGFGFNAVTGDFSRGAAGFWIENGEITFPVSEVTISANFNDMLLGIDCIADDISFRSSTSAPTFRIAQMTLAGE